MAIIRISNAGGLFSSSGTWDGGVIPTSADDIRGDSLSGPLTVDSNRTVRSVDLAGYIRKLTINSNVVLSLGGNSPITSTFSTAFATNGGYDFLGSGTTQGLIARTATGQLAWSGSPNRTSPHGLSGSLPNFRNNNTGAITSTTNLYFTNLRVASELCINGTYSTLINGSIIATDPFIRFGGTQPYTMNGTGSITGNLALITNTGPATLIINTPGTIMTATGSQNVGLVLGAHRTDPGNITFQHISGTVIGITGIGSNPSLLINSNLTNTSGSVTLGLTAGTYWRCYTNLSVGSTAPFTSRNLINFSGPCKFDQLSFFSAHNSTSTTNRYFVKLQPIDAGTSIECNDLIISQAYQTNTTVGAVKNDYDYEISPTMSITVNNSIEINGGSDQPAAPVLPTIEVKSTSSGTAASLIVNSYKQYISNTRFTDIDCSLGNTLYGQGITLSNTTNITQYTLPPASGGGGESSYTFVN